MEHPLDSRAKRYERKWADPRKALWISSKDSAKTRGFEHNIKVEDIIIPTHCPVLGLELKPKGRDENSMTLDRIDTNKGYVKGNIAVISWKANKLKSNGTVEEFEKILSYMKKELF